MAQTNGFFGHLQSPFTKNDNLWPKIQQQCKNKVNYLSKLGIIYAGHHDLNIEVEQIFVEIDGKTFQLGKTGMLEFEDVQIKQSIRFPQEINDDRMYIDYQYA